ncbi:hypothetical protein Glove_167g86 [Diversispora epigaea]|uniref:Uncharacterized protein n=1 Tax=Diversispora epigaea TaxID=1348612 RepID=A0A397IZ17_9GLOM|nr:hypothetical protein Glove_167g86 [Diversispora epigaea]
MTRFWKNKKAESYRKTLDGHTQKKKTYLSSFHLTQLQEEDVNENDSTNNQVFTSKGDIPFVKKEEPDAIYQTKHFSLQYDVATTRRSPPKNSPKGTTFLFTSSQSKKPKTHTLQPLYFITAPVHQPKTSHHMFLPSDSYLCTTVSPKIFASPPISP